MLPVVLIGHREPEGYESRLFQLTAFSENLVCAPFCKKNIASIRPTPHPPGLRLIGRPAYNRHGYPDIESTQTEKRVVARNESAWSLPNVSRDFFYKMAHGQGFLKTL